MKLRGITRLLVVTVLTTSVLVGCGNKENNEMGSFKDGIYKAESEKDRRGYIGLIEIEVENGKITTVNYDEKNTDSSKTPSTEFFPELEAALIENQDVDKIDVIAGATASTSIFKDAAEKALRDAK